MLISNFTLYGILKKGNKPDFHNSMKADEAKNLYNVVYSKTRYLLNNAKKNINKKR